MNNALDLYIYNTYFYDIKIPAILKSAKYVLTFTIDLHYIKTVQ